MKKLAVAVIVLSLVASPILPSVLAQDAPAVASGTAEAVMQGLVKDVLAVLRDTSITVDQRRDKVQQIAIANMNFEVIGRLSLGQNFRKLSADQQKEYQAEFKQLVAATYGHTTDGYTDEDVKITGQRDESNGDSTVTTTITGTKNGKANSSIANVDYRLRKQGDAWKVIDFTVDGVSLVNNYRSQFQSVMSGGGADQLLQMLKDKNAAATASPK